ncbi:ATP-grasp domain-containing protein [Flammeovirga yaeyamensis]|nr:ATP-grasp domain-containing protein [Flammeovirga yaeyamensis]
MSRSLSFMTSVNPGMKYGGFFDYSKYDVLKQIPQKYVPKSDFYFDTPSVDEVKASMKSLGLEYPIILKPNEGERGSGVEKIQSDIDLKEYLKPQPKEIILQEFIDTNDEYGVMYVRYPDQLKGKITSIVYKGELYVVGDGVSNLLQLFEGHQRAFLYLDFLKEKYDDRLHEVVDDGEVFMLSKMGNHSRGAIFNDANYLISQLDTKVFDEISSHIDGFYFGRYDLKAKDEQALINGDFKVMELNGVNSEPAHIYDPENSLFAAYKDLFAHWWRIYKIGKQNRKQGHSDTPFPVLLQSLMNR